MSPTHVIKQSVSPSSLSRKGIPSTLFISLLLNRLQKLQNSTARLVVKSKLRDHITPVLEKLHWLPVKKRIDFKILCITYQCIYGNAPTYLKESIPRYTPARSLEI